ncbi:hypothetical protein ASPCAL02482 [Aspergillus calidoustus]|uniref:Uncharacterized protein n=1 Tax=Aspergillus calidoustus TaxID=454130 RepID=A0A0U5GKM2_ASPCI|nr:hypothetical protein ASPCAL02482 [Aspergillus calidoustus]
MEEVYTSADPSIEPTNNGDEWQVSDLEASPSEAIDTHEDTDSIIDPSNSYNQRKADLQLLSELELFPDGYNFDGSEFENVQDVLQFAPGQFEAAPELFVPTLIPLLGEKTDTAKDFRGTQWRNAQFCLFRKNQPRDFLPVSWSVREDGVNLRARIQGGTAARTLVLEFTVFRDHKPVHQAYLEFDVALDIQSYNPHDNIKKNVRRGGNRNQRRGDEEDQVNPNSYAVLRFRTAGGVGRGLDYDVADLTADDQKVFSYGRLLSRNFRPTLPGQSEDLRTVVIRINANHVLYGNETSQGRRANANNDRFYRLVFQLDKDARPILWPYCTEQGNPQLQ